MLPYLLLILIVIVVIFSSMIVIRVLIKRSFYHPPVLLSCNPIEYGLQTKELFIPTKNSKKIQAFLTTNSSNKPLLIFLHGWANASDTFYKLAGKLVEKEWQILLLNARNHGKSDSDKYTTMVKFIEDLECAIKYVKNTFPEKKIILIGHSLGAATCIYLTSKNVDILRLVSISSFSDVGITMSRSFLQKHMPQWIIRFVLKYIEQQIGATIDELSPINRIKKIKIPILFLHGMKDKIVPVGECSQLYRQCVSKYSKQYLIDGANHSSILANENTFNVILDFIQNFEN